MERETSLRVCAHPDPNTQCTVAFCINGLRHIGPFMVCPCLLFTSPFIESLAPASGVDAVLHPGEYPLLYFARSSAGSRPPPPVLGSCTVIRRCCHPSRVAAPCTAQERREERWPAGRVTIPAAAPWRALLGYNCPPPRWKAATAFLRLAFPASVLGVPQPQSPPRPPSWHWPCLPAFHLPHWKTENPIMDSKSSQ